MANKDSKGHSYADMAGRPMRTAQSLLFMAKNGDLEVVKSGTVIYLSVRRLKARYRFTTEDDARQAEMMVQQIELAETKEQP